MELSQALLTGQNLTLGDALGTGLKVTGLGLTIVFSVLVILMIVLYLFKVIFYKTPKKTAAPVQAAPAPAPAEEAAVSDEPDDEELIAVLTAAVAASLNTSTYNLKIKSYRRVNNSVPAWNKAGVTETISNRLS